jgi:hypothetical protein
MENAKASKYVSATRVVASVFGTLVGLAAIEHGYFEIRQGNVKPGSLLFPAIGPEQRFWEYGTEHAMTMIPSLLVTGILAMIVGILIVVWANRSIQKKCGALVMLALCVLSFAVGGGFAPIFLAGVATIAATRIGKPLTWWRTYIPAAIQTFLAWLWPWSLIAFVLVFLFSVEIAIFGYPLVSFVGADATLALLNHAALVMTGLMVFAPLTAFAYDGKGCADKVRAR